MGEQSGEASVLSVEIECDCAILFSLLCDTAASAEIGLDESSGVLYEREKCNEFLFLFLLTLVAILAAEEAFDSAVTFSESSVMTGNRTRDTAAAFKRSTDFTGGFFFICNGEQLTISGRDGVIDRLIGTLDSAEVLLKSSTELFADGIEFAI
jgi:hypothetical protein